MNEEFSHKLASLLAAGWEVKGFQQTVDLNRDDDCTASVTSGYSILIQNYSQMAIVNLSYGNGGLDIRDITYLTGGKP